MARWGKLALAAVVVQLLFWLAFVPVFINPEAPEVELVEIDRFEQARPAAPDGATLSATRFVEAEPDRVLRDTGYHAGRAYFTLDDVPAEGLGLVHSNTGDNVHVYVNGSPIDLPGRIELPAPTYHGLHKEIIPISPGLLRSGENTLTTVSTVELPREVAIREPRMARLAEAKAAFGWKYYTYTGARDIAIVICVVLTVMTGVAAARARDRDLPKWLFLLVAGWTLHSLFFRWFEFPLHGGVRGLYYAVTTMFVSAAWAIFADAWSGDRLRWFRPGVWAVFGAGVTWCAWWLLGSDDIGRFLQVETAVEWVGLALSAATVARLVWHFATDRSEDRYWETAALILLAMLMAFYLISLIVDGLNKPYLTLTQPLVLLVLVAAFFGRNFELFRSREQLNAELESQLVERTAELEQAHAREKLFLREQAHQEERRRIMRDMHDGMGSNLMSMLLAARRGKVDAGSVARGIQTVIDEMRLMIDSMDSVGESLGSALVLFRERAQARVTEAGYAFEWEDESHGNLPELDPRQVLQVFRVLQEAITNALKHSDGDTIRVTVREDELRVSDNGSSFEGPRRGGRGLDNMEARAKSIGGTFAIAHEGGETVAQIGLPREAGEV